jgi:hypothetical protein
MPSKHIAAGGAVREGGLRGVQARVSNPVIDPAEVDSSPEIRKI